MCYRLLLSVFIIFQITTKLNAQQGINAAGSTIMSKTGNISYSIGQINYINTPISNFGSLSQGQQQVYIGLTTDNQRVYLQLYHRFN